MFYITCTKNVYCFFNIFSCTFNLIFLSISCKIELCICRCLARSNFSCNIFFFLLINMLIICSVYARVIIINLRWTLRVYLFAAISYGPAESDNQIPDSKVTETAHGLITLRNILRIRYMRMSRNHDFGGSKW